MIKSNCEMAMLRIMPVVLAACVRCANRKLWKYNIYYVEFYWSNLLISEVHSFISFNIKLPAADQMRENRHFKKNCL